MRRIQNLTSSVTHTTFRSISEAACPKARWTESKALNRAGRPSTSGPWQPHLLSPARFSHHPTSPFLSFLLPTPTLSLASRSCYLQLLQLRPRSSPPPLPPTNTSASAGPRSDHPRSPYHFPGPLLTGLGVPPEDRHSALCFCSLCFDSGGKRAHLFVCLSSPSWRTAAAIPMACTVPLHSPARTFAESVTSG